MRTKAFAIAHSLLPYRPHVYTLHEQMRSFGICVCGLKLDCVHGLKLDCVHSFKLDPLELRRFGSAGRNRPFNSENRPYMYMNFFVCLVEFCHSPMAW